MDLKIIKGNIDHMIDCEEALLKSQLGLKYFCQTESARNSLEEGFSKGEIYVAIDENEDCIGFIWYILNGIFPSYPYLHIIAIKEENRGKGIGRKLMEFFEISCFANYSKVFLVVADFNPRAKLLYEEIGYKQVGAVPSLYREGITEFLMMKVRY